MIRRSLFKGLLVGLIGKTSAATEVAKPSEGPLYYMQFCGRGHAYLMSDSPSPYISQPNPFEPVCPYCELVRLSPAYESTTQEKPPAPAPGQIWEVSGHRVLLVSTHETLWRWFDIDMLKMCRIFGASLPEALSRGRYLGHISEWNVTRSL